MKMIIDMPSDFNPREDDCVSCPFLAESCSTTIDSSKCPLYNAKLAIPVDIPELNNTKALFERKDGSKDQDWSKVNLYAVEEP